MRIAHIILTSKFAGSERYALELAAEQAKQHDVTLVLRNSACIQHPRAIAHRVDPKVTIHKVNDWFAGFQVRRFLRQYSPDIAHAHLSRACKALAAISGICPRIATLHIHYKAAQHQALDGLIAIAPWQLNDLPIVLRERSVQIDNWTLPHTTDANARSRLRAQLNLNDSDFLFGSIGRIENSKGMDLLLAAHKQIADPSCKLVIVGEGSQRRKLMELANDTAQLIGFSGEPQAWLSAFDCFVSASRSEPFGLVMLEAMQARLPIIASASQGARHLQKHIGRELVALDDVNALAQAMASVRAARPGRQDYDLSGFRIGPQAAAIEQYYQQCLVRFQPKAKPLDARG